jgi:hypothetical protein
MENLKEVNSKLINKKLESIKSSKIETTAHIVYGSVSAKTPIHEWVVTHIKMFARVFQEIFGLSQNDKADTGFIHGQLYAMIVLDSKAYNEFSYKFLELFTGAFPADDVLFKSTCEIFDSLKQYLMLI